MTRRILIRADDLGYSRGVNYGIADSVRHGIIRSVGVMPNMPEAEMGLRLLEGVSVCYGQHTNVCVGQPLTDPARIPSLCQPNGEFKASREYREAFKRGEDFVDVDEACLEIEAQLTRFIELVGDEPHYFEGHAIASKNFFTALEVVAKRHELPYLGMSFDFSAPITFRRSRLYTSMDSMGPDYDLFESLKRAALKDYDEDACCMFVCHPGYLDAYILATSSLTIPRTQEVAMAMDPKTREWLSDHGVEVITYDDLA